MGSEQHIEVIARGLAIHQGRVLVCRDLAGGYAYLPGGHIDPGETAAKALAREFAEESGLQVKVGELVMAGEQIFEQQGRSGKVKQKHEINMVFHVEHASGGWPDEPSTLEDHIRFEWIEPAAVIDDDIRPTSAKALIAAGKTTFPGAWISE